MQATKTGIQRRIYKVRGCTLLVTAFTLTLAIAGGQQNDYMLGDDPIFEDRFECPEFPIADAGLDINVNVGVSTYLDGGGSTGSGCELLYRWTIIDRPQSSGAAVFEPFEIVSAFIADQAGVYEIELSLIRDDVIVDSDSLIVTAAGQLSSDEEIGPDGGGVGLSDGSSVLIPPGALDSDVMVSITEIPPPASAILPPTAEYVGNVYSLTPANQSFNKPVILVIPYDPGLLPVGHTEGSISIYRQADWDEFDMVAAWNTDPEPEGLGQKQYPGDNILVVNTVLFSAYSALSVNHSSEFIPTTLSEPTASVVVRRPPALRSERPNHHRCERLVSPNVYAHDRGQGPLATRAASAIEALVIHSTNNGNVGRDFNSELGWGADFCNQAFAHYYIDRDGQIFQLVEDLTIAFHAGSGQFGITNGNSIGIELFNNVGEPYDGRQVTSLIRLVDFLAEKYSIPRPSRDPLTGLISRNVVNISAGGDRLVAHLDIALKCDPNGTFMNSGEIREATVQPGVGTVCVRPEHPLASGSPQASALMDVVLDQFAILERSAQHTGMVNTHGGDAFELGNAGNGGVVIFREDASQVATIVGNHHLTQWQQNDPQLAGPGPLIVEPGAVRNIGPGIQEFTDVIIDGQLNVSGSTEFRLTGSFYVSPIGQIVSRDGRNGADMTVYSRGAPVVQGLIDARGDHGVSAAMDGGVGGNITFVFAAPGPLLVPTIYTRGGDADFADVSLAGGGPSGGDGGNVDIDVGSTHLFVGGGIGPVIGNSTIPPWHSDAIDPSLLDPGRWAGDYLPVPPPFSRSSIGVGSPSSGERVRKWTTAAQPGFLRGILTSGGMGGWGQSAPPRHGGSAGSGGNIEISLDVSSNLSLRDIDLITGAEIESLRHSFFVAGGTSPQVVCTASGAHGGFGSSMGDGGSGGAAGDLVLSGGVLNPPPSQFIDIHEIRGFPPGDEMELGDVNCSTGRIMIGQVVEAQDSVGNQLYRLRLSMSGTSLLGGLGGIPSQTGVVGPLGASGTISGLPTQ